MSSVEDFKYLQIGYIRVLQSNGYKLVCGTWTLQSLINSFDVEMGTCQLQSSDINACHKTVTLITIMF